MTMAATRIDRGSTATTTIYSEDGRLVFERRFAAPRALVWRAFTDPELVPRWWGKHGSVTEVVEMDVRPGGRWRYISRAADREDIVFFGEYLTVDAPRAYVWTFMFEFPGGVAGGPETHEFDEIDGGTLVRTIGDMGSREALEGALASGMVEGALEAWERLEALLPEL